MFEKLFAESGLSLDRLRVLLEVGAAGSISKAAAADPVRQSQYSRQIRELEEFFRVKLIERYSKGMQLTANGKELARISRFFLLGLSNFQRGCLAEDQSFRIGASTTILQTLVIPILTRSTVESRNRYVTEIVTDDEIERRLHDLSLDFGIVSKPELSRPLQVHEIGKSKLSVFLPKRLCRSRTSALKAVGDRSLCFAVARELDSAICESVKDFEIRLICDSILAARDALEQQCLAVVLPRFIAPADAQKFFWQIPCPALHSDSIHFRLAWNPRLLRLNPHVVRFRDFLVRSLTAEFNRGIFV